jgi:lipid II:glycine glycyltransferase (peptidoglycan interpeptide bridge formation enzyme)
MPNAQTLSRDARTIGDGGSRLAHSRWTVEGLQAEQWDQFVTQTPGGDIVQTTAWAQGKRALGFETDQVNVRRHGEIVGGALIVVKRLRPFGRVAYVARGPLVSPDCPEEAARVLDAVERIARARRIHHLIVQPPEGGDAVVAELASRGYAPNAPSVAPTATLRLDLAPSLDQILSHMSARRRTQIRRSERQGVQIRLGSRDDLDLFCRLHQGTAQRQGFAALSRSYLRHQWDALSGTGSVQLILAYHDDRPLAAIWLTAFGDTVTYRLPGWSGEGKDHHPNVACHWGAIRWAKEHGYRWYDLGGIELSYALLLAAGRLVPEAMLRSHANFKTKFGASVVLLPTASQLTFNPLARVVVGVAYTLLSRYRAFDRLLNRMRSG